MSVRRRKKKLEEYYGGRTRSLVELVARMVADDPSLGREENAGLLHAKLTATIPAYSVKESCVGCRRSMRITLYEADLHDALLLLAMAKAVRENVRKGLPFTEANKVHLPTLSASHATIKRSTKCDYLGFVKQPNNWRGTGFWLLTAWGWKALRGEPVPRGAKYWEGKMIGRTTETTTLGTMFKTHRDLVEMAIAKQKAVRADHRALFSDYEPSAWYEYGGLVPDDAPVESPYTTKTLEV